MFLTITYSCTLKTFFNDVSKPYLLQTRIKGFWFAYFFFFRILRNSTEVLKLRPKRIAWVLTVVYKLNPVCMFEYSKFTNNWKWNHGNLNFLKLKNYTSNDTVSCLNEVIRHDPRGLGMLKNDGDLGTRQLPAYGSCVFKQLVILVTCFELCGSDRINYFLDPQFTYVFFF